ncbi:MAG: hypothetical protein HY518_04945 [Candidatus Aenigmarchaeota archaeon]|nr:hypothetical protein [Candidatus Aenigmarchaeota archaeon]
MPETLQPRRLTYDASSDPVPVTLMGFPVGQILPLRYLQLPDEKQVVYHERIMNIDPYNPDILVAGVLVEESGNNSRRITVDEVVDEMLKQAVLDGLRLNHANLSYVGFDPVEHNLISEDLSRRRQSGQSV